ncbi:hypothetical protein XAC3608_1680015 [Xanthomonas citri pv. citri]|nr:hypothetical protein XAC3608_1680015 [Xanthomonas citri pv. citri]
MRENVIAFAAFNGLPCVSLRRESGERPSWCIDSSRASIAVTTEHEAGVRFFRECLAERFLLETMIGDVLKERSASLGMTLHVADEAGQRILAEAECSFVRNEHTLRPEVMTEVTAWIEEHHDTLADMKAVLLEGVSRP